MHRETGIDYDGCISAIAPERLGELTQQEVKTRQHDWKLMTMTDVVVIGVDPSTDEPFGIPIGDTSEGINCWSCGVAWFPEIDTATCDA